MASAAVQGSSTEAQNVTRWVPTAEDRLPPCFGVFSGRGRVDVSCEDPEGRNERRQDPAEQRHRCAYVPICTGVSPTVGARGDLVL